MQLVRQTTENKCFRPHNYFDLSVYIFLLESVSVTLKKIKNIIKNSVPHALTTDHILLSYKKDILLPSVEDYLYFLTIYI